jgi:hypothetical protein
VGRKQLIVLSTVGVILVVAALVFMPKVWSVFADMQAGKVPRYEVGEQRGAEFCGGCHQEIYAAWSQNSRHAIATTSVSFLDFKRKFTDNFAMNSMMGEQMCYACHGIKEVDDGVNCETCHGTVSDDVPLMETHATKFKPGRAELREPGFCATCHTMQSPLTGDRIMPLYDEWEGSEAASQGITCQGCHMEPRGSQLRYHGFDSIARNVDIYRDDLVLTDVRLDFPEFTLAIENRVMGHAVPPSGPSRVMVLEISFLDADGAQVHTAAETFAKRFDLMPVIGLMPHKLTENTQLQSGEVRALSFTLPTALKDQVSTAVLTLRFYDVADDHQGDISQAHWISEPILEQGISF